MGISKQQGANRIWAQETSNWGIYLRKKKLMMVVYWFPGTQRELSIAMEAVKEKRRREAALFKEKNDMLDDRDVRKYVQQAQKVADRIQEKIAAKNYDWGECVCITMVTDAH